MILLFAIMSFGIAVTLPLTGLLWGVSSSWTDQALSASSTSSGLPERAPIPVDGRVQLNVSRIQEFPADIRVVDANVSIDSTRAESPANDQPNAGLVTAGLVFLALVVSVLARWLHRYLNRQRSRQGTASTWVSHWSIKGVVQPLLMLMQGGVWLATLIYCTDLFPISRDWRNRALNFLARSFTNPIFKLGTANYSILDLLKILVLVIALWFSIRILIGVVRSRLLRSFGADREIQNAIALSIQFLLMGIGLIVILQGLGFDISALAILASVLGVGIGFGLQNLANNFISGFVILFERQIRAGDFVQIGDLTGTVEHIGIRSTEVRTLDSVTIIVPNSELVQTKVANWSHGHPVSRLHIPFGVAYGSNIRLLRTSVLEAVQVHPEVLRYPQPQIWFEGFGDSSLNFDLLIWIREPRQQFRIRSDLYYLIEANLRRYRIEIPFPQRDLHLRSPQLNDLRSLWHRQQNQGTSPPPSRDAALTEPFPTDEQSLHSPSPDTAQPESNTDALLAELMECSFLVRHEGELADPEIDQLVQQMRGPNGVVIKDRRYGLRTYAQCFVGHEAVNWIIQTQKATREEAIRIGKVLIERGIVHHVTDEHSFEDQNLYYRFYEDEQPDH